MDRSLLYVSRRLATPGEIAAIVALSRTRNARLDVTGALVASQNRFAQILEGPAPSIDELMTSICRDQRHRDVQVLVDEEVETRRFVDWSLAYSGSSQFVDGLIEVLAKQPGAPPDPYHLHRLTRSMAEFTRDVH